jgi:hypothetical protein
MGDTTPARRRRQGLPWRPVVAPEREDLAGGPGPSKLVVVKCLIA